MRGNVCLLFSVLYGSVPGYKMFFCCFELYKLFQNLLRKWQSKKFWKLSRIKHEQNVNKKTEPLIEYCCQCSLRMAPKNNAIKSKSSFTQCIDFTKRLFYVFRRLLPCLLQLMNFCNQWFVVGTAWYYSLCYLVVPNHL